MRACTNPRPVAERSAPPGARRGSSHGTDRIAGRREHHTGWRADCNTDRATDRHVDRETGSTLVELMVAMAATLIIFGATLSTAVQQSAQRQMDAETSLAIAAAESNLEELRSIDFTALPGLDGTGFDVPDARGNPGGGLRPVPGDPDGLPGEIAVTMDQSLGGATLYRVRARVRWTGARGRRTLDLETLIGNRR